MQIEVIRPFWFNGEARAQGDVLDVPDVLAAELIGLRKAIGHVGEVDAPAPAKRGRPRKEAAPAVEEPVDLDAEPITDPAAV